MLRNIKQLYGEKLRASDGEIGHLKDFYFDDQKWVVRYVVVNTGSWLSGRLVLIAPDAFGNLDQDKSLLLVNLTRQQIENSPPIELHKPVSRQYEEEYYRYYEFIPIVQPRPFPLPSEEAGESDNGLNVNDPHLRSTHALNGYHLQTSEETIGHITDFMMDDKSWAICHLVVETGRWLSGKEIVISPSHVDRINYEDSKVFVNLTKEAILQAPEFHLPTLGTTNPDTQNLAGQA